MQPLPPPMTPPPPAPPAAVEQPDNVMAVIRAIAATALFTVRLVIIDLSFHLRGEQMAGRLCDRRHPKIPTVTRK